MLPLLVRTIRHARQLLATLTILLSACGGGGSPQTPDASASTAQEPGHRVIQSVARSSETQAQTLTVRAYANLAGDVGALMTVRVDGVEIGQTEVRSTQPADYSFAAPTLKPGSQVDVVYSNDGSVNGLDRNLYVLQLSHGRTAVLPAAGNSTFDRGIGAAAFDGVDVLAGGTGIFWNAALRLVWPEPNLSSSITVRASAQAAGGTGATMVVRVDGTVVGTSTVSSAEPADFSYAAPAFAAGSKVDVAFTNAGSADGVTRTLNVHYLIAGTTVLRTTDSGVKFDAGSGLAAYDGAGQSAGQVALAANGALRGTWPAANMTDSLTVRATGSLLANVGPIVQILADGVLLGTAEVRSASPQDITLPALPLKPGQRIEVRPTNLESGRSLGIAYVLSGKTVLQANAGSLDAPWPEPNLTDTLNIRARADLAGGVGAIMQVLVDGILVGSTEVSSITHVDYRFAVPPMTAGRKVDVVYANDGQVDGVDRNLHIAYLTTGNTVMLPNAAGNTLDRGVGAAAFDGVDVTAGTGTLAWSGALRSTWPAANITGTVTVRASATAAGGTGALMTLWVDGVAVSAAIVSSTTPIDFLMPTTALTAGSKVAITFGNPGTVDGVARALNIHYLIAGSTFLTPTSSGVAYSEGNLAGSWPAPNLTDTLTVRAYADLASGVGAVMAVRVDGVQVDEFEVKSTLPQDYSVAIPKLKPGSNVDIAYTNNTTATGGEDRNLYVLQLNHGATAVAPKADNSSIDRGIGAAAFDGVDVVVGSTGLFWDAALRLKWPEPNLTSRITVRASGTAAGGVAPTMVVRVDGIIVGTATISTTQASDFHFAAPAFSAGSKVDVAFTNAGSADGVTRTLNVHYLMAGTTVLRPTAAGVKFDAGLGLAAYDGSGQTAGLVALTANGALRGTWPATNMTDSLTVRATGSLLANVGPIVQILADGVLLGTAEVRSTSPQDITLPALPLKPGQRIEVRPTNLEAGRSLSVAYALSGKTVLLATAGSLDAPWPEPNLTDTLNIRARGMASGGVWPHMQVLVDGILLGSVKVSSTDHADYRFAAPPMSAGRKLDIVYTNNEDAPIAAGEDRNLFIAYATTGNTTWLPGSAGNVFDRGVGAAAFDGADLVAGTANLYWSGALRSTWPAANITDAVTVRASATAAGGTGALMTLWVDGVAVSAAIVSSTTPTDFLMPTTALAAGSKVAITFGNPGTVDGVTRALNVHYLIAGSTFLTPTSSGVAYSNGNLAGNWPTPNLTDTLTVRAYADLAGGIGAVMAVRVDGVQVDEFEVKSTLPQDYSVAIPRLKPGSLVDLVHSNDATVNGVNRNLYVLQLNHGSTAVVPKADNSSIDRGTGAAAFDGIDVVAGGTGLYWNGALRLAWPEPNLTSRLTVRTSAQAAGGVAPTMVVRVDGTVVGTSTISNAEPADFSYPAPAFAAGSRVDVAFTNAGSADGVVRTLNVHYLMAGTTVLRPTDAGVKFDAGSGLAAYDGVGQTNGLVALSANGALRGTWPAANMTDSLTVRASGTLAGNVGPIVQVLADGVLLGSAEVRSTFAQDITLPSLPLKPGQRIEVRPTNLTAGRSLNLAYALSGKTVLLASGTTLNAPWPETNLTDTLNIRARADLAGGVGANMQVLVDGILVGSAEVNSSVNADYRFATLPLSAGRKIDVVYTNDGQVNGVDRNLHIAYLTSTNTVVLPNAAGNVLDRGAGSAAFDGADVIAGTGTMAWNGALRTTWPAANITDTVTVRASATAAGGAGALMTLWVDGVAVSAAQVSSSAPTDFLMPTTALRAGSKVAVTFGNPGTVDGVVRALNIHYLIAGSSFLTPTSPGVSYSAGNLSGTWPSPNLTDTLTVRAHADLAGGVGAMVQLRVNGVVIATREITSTVPTDHVFAVPKIQVGDRIDVVYVNDGQVNGADRNLYVQYIRGTGWTLAAFGGNVSLDSGSGEAAFDGNGVSATQGAVYGNGALRFNVASTANMASSAAQYAAARLLHQASFGATAADIERVVQIGRSAWIDEQIALPFSPDMVAHVEAKFALGDSHRPGGANYTSNWVGQRFWAAAASSPHQLRRRVGFALHQTLVASQIENGLYDHARGYANYVDTLNRLAFGNYRELLEEISLNPMMGLYLSHMRNRPEDAASTRMPDENFARELMQLFSIGLHELNIDGSPVLDASGQPVETYSNADVMALAKVFTGWSWGFADNLLTENSFRWSSPDLKTAANDQRIDLQRMKAYPGQHSLAEKRLFAGKPWAATLPAGQSAQADLKAALDTLFNHPNVGPFIGRQLIQRLVTSHPSTGYIARVATVFNNNGRGVRGDLAAVVRAILMDAEAQTLPASNVGKLREPVLAVSQWLRGLGAVSAGGEYPINYDLDPLGQRAWHAPSVFGYYRPGYVPPNTSFAMAGTTVPELQVANESSTTRWVNLAMAMAGGGLAWNGSANDVTANLQPLIDLALAGNIDAMVERLNLLLYAGRMSASLKADITDATASVTGTDAASQANRARVALFLALAAPDYLIQR